MKHLIIVAHPSSRSFSIYLAEQLKSIYEKNGWEAEVRDLYKLNFNPVLSYDDLGSLKNKIIPEDIKIEQDIIESADLISVIYPLWWAGFPAILKGYIDRVFSNGFAFQYTGNGPKGLLTGKKVVLHTTMGNTVEEYEEKELIEPFKAIHGDEIFTYCGMDIKEHLFYPQITLADEVKRDHYLKMALDLYSEKSLI